MQDGSARTTGFENAEAKWSTKLTNSDVITDTKLSQSNHIAHSYQRESTSLIKVNAILSGVLWIDFITNRPICHFQRV